MTASAPMTALNSLLAHALPLVPKALVWRVAQRYVAGVEMEDAVRVLRGLAAEGVRGTLDYLGERVEKAEDAEEARRVYQEALERLHSGKVPSGISVKLTQLGLGIDPHLARSNVEDLAARAARLGRFVRLDMEDSSTTDATLGIYRELRPRFPNLGLALQAYLRRTLDDARSLLALGPDVRICKGIYNEPERLAFKDPEEIRRSFLEVLRALLGGGARVAIATHDPALIEKSLELTDALGAGPERHEFQMLLGVGRGLWARLRERGRRLRVYVPFGRHWYPYCLRRLRENPRVAGYVLRNLLVPG